MYPAGQIEGTCIKAQITPSPLQLMFGGCPTSCLLYACTAVATVVRGLRRLAGLVAGKFCTAAANTRNA